MRQKKGVLRFCDARRDSFAFLEQMSSWSPSERSLLDVHKMVDHRGRVQAAKTSSLDQAHRRFAVLVVLEIGSYGAFLASMALSAAKNGRKSQLAWGDCHAHACTSLNTEWSIQNGKPMLAFRLSELNFSRRGGRVAWSTNDQWTTSSRQQTKWREPSTPEPSHEEPSHERFRQPNSPAVRSYLAVRSKARKHDCISTSVLASLSGPTFPGTTYCR